MNHLDFMISIPSSVKRRGLPGQTSNSIAKTEPDGSNESNEYLFPSPSDLDFQIDDDREIIGPPSVPINSASSSSLETTDFELSGRRMRSLRRHRFNRSLQENNQELDGAADLMPPSEQDKNHTYPEGLFHPQDYSLFPGKTFHDSPIGSEEYGATVHMPRSSSTSIGAEDPANLEYGFAAKRDYDRTNRRMQQEDSKESKSDWQGTQNSYYYQLEHALRQMSTSILDSMSSVCWDGTDVEGNTSVGGSSITKNPTNENACPFDIIQDEHVASILKKNHKKKLEDGHCHPDKMRTSGDYFSGNSSVDTHLRALEIVARNKTRPKFRAEGSGQLKSTHADPFDDDRSMSYFRRHQAL